MNEEKVRQYIHTILSSVEESMLSNKIQNETILSHLINKVDKFWYMGIFNYMLATPLYKHYPNVTHELIEKLEVNQIEEHLDHILAKVDNQESASFILEKIYHKVNLQSKKEIAKAIQYTPLYKIFVEQDYDLSHYQKTLHFIQKEKIKINRDTLEGMDPYCFYMADTLDSFNQRINAHYELLNHFPKFNMVKYFKKMKENIPQVYIPSKQNLMEEFKAILDNFVDTKIALKEKEELEKSLTNQIVPRPQTVSKVKI